MNNYYVYIYFDPFTDIPFYVGKGKDYRYKSHLKPSLRQNPNNTPNPMFYHKIASIYKAGSQPRICLYAIDLSEQDALIIETNLIEIYGRRFVEGGTLFNIVSEGNISAKTYKPWTEERKTEHRNRSKETRIFDPSYEELFDLFVTQNLRRKDIAKDYGVSEVLVKKRLQEYGIRKPIGGMRKIPDEVAGIINMMHNERGMSQIEIAKYYGVSQVTVLNYMKRHNIERRDIVTYYKRGDND